MHQINQKIVGYAVRRDNGDIDIIDIPELETMHEALERGDVLHGSTYKFKTPASDHAFYLTINDIILNQGTEHEQRLPAEIFLNSKDMVQFQWIVALTRLISAVFRKGGDITFIVEELKAVFDPSGGYWDRSLFIPSIVAKIGYVIEQHFMTIGLIKNPAIKPPE